MDKTFLQDPQKLDTLRMLYPIFKQEVFDRRDRMMKVASLAGGFLLIFLALILFLLSIWKPLSLATWPIIIGVILFTGLTLHHIKQHSRRHAQAKQAVIDIEKALGLFEEGAYFSDRGLYPPHWQVRPPRDYSLLFYAACLIALAILAILPLLVSV